MQFRFIKALLLLAAVTFVFPACETTGVGVGVGVNVGGDSGHRGGPPPHAPAHGYRHKHKKHGHDLKYDSGLGVYVVVGMSNTYFSGDLYYRFSGDRWEVSSNPSGGWSHSGNHKIPHGLEKKHHGKDKGNKNDKGKGNSQGKGKGKGKGNR